MESFVMEAAKGQGIWVALFVAMLFYVLRENSKREQNYQEIIKQLTEKFTDIEESVKALSDKITTWVSKR